MSRLLLNFDVASLYPSLICEYGYSSRNQKDATKYVELRKKRIEAKHNGDKKMASALKLPLNTYYGALGAKSNALFDIRQCRSVCISGQCALLILIHDLLEVPSVRLVESNTDAVCFEIDEDKRYLADKVLDDWQKRYRLELEEDNVLKIVMRDINNYCEIVQTPKGKIVNFKGGCFAGCPDIEIDSDNIIHTHYKTNIKANSLTICAEAMLKELLFNIPCEDTINKCNEPIRFQMITHLGGTYEKCVLEDKDGNQSELQRNNRVYAGIEKNNCKIYKIKPNGRKDSLANCPKNPIVDNKNEISIDKINKLWYIKYTKQKISEFLGKGEVFMEEKLDKLKKDELIELVKDLQEKVDTNECQSCDCMTVSQNDAKNLYHKIQEFRKEIRNTNFILDKVLPNNLGGGEYVSIEQYYRAVQNACLKTGLDFSFDIVNVDQFDLAAFKPATGAPQNIATVRCVVTFTDIDTGLEKSYTEISQGSDMLDKAVNGASTLAFRNWFDKNFTPNIFNGEIVRFGEEDNTVILDNVNIPVEQKTEVKPKVFVSTEKKEEIKKEITTTQQTSNDKNDVEHLTSLIYEYREKSGNAAAGASTLTKIVEGTISDAEVLSKTLSFENAIDKLGK